MLKPEFQNASVSDVNGEKTNPELPYLIVSDGNFIKEEMKVCNLTKQKIKQAVKSQNLTMKDVFLMTCDDKMNYSIIKKEK